MHVWVGSSGLRATASIERSDHLPAVHDQLCRRLEAAAPYPIGPVHVCRLLLGSLSVDARRLS